MNALSYRDLFVCSAKCKKIIIHLQIVKKIIALVHGQLYLLIHVELIISTIHITKMSSKSGLFPNEYWSVPHTTTNGTYDKELIAFLVPVVWPNCRFGLQNFESAAIVPILKFGLHFQSFGDQTCNLAKPQGQKMQLTIW